MVNLEELSKVDLIKMVNMYAKNWLAHDGCWFLAIEQQEGIEKAIEYDEASWERFTRVEARRIMKEFGIEKGSGIEGLKKALSYRLYATLNKDAFEEVDGKFIYKMVFTSEIIVFWHGLNDVWISPDRNDGDFIIRYFFLN